MRVKMCGMRTITAARAAEEAGADYVGFIFAKNSRRYVAPEAAREIVRTLRRVKSVGVFVDAPMDEVNEIAAYVGLDYVQLHGHESAEMARQSERPVIKAYRYGDDFSVEAANAYPAEMILVDSYVAGAAGGTGTAFHWQEAAREIARVTKPVLIAGGITAENVGEAAALFQPFGVDVSGGLEKGGEKSEEKICAFMEAMRAARASLRLTNSLSSTRMGDTLHGAKIIEARRRCNVRDILAEIVEKKRTIVAEAKKRRPLDELKADLPCGTFRMAEHFRWRGWGLIAECKLQSPAKGRLTTAHSVLELADIYTAAGAAVLSVHTDPHFLGSNEDFAAVRARVDTPLLRKDFIIDPYQVYEARALGADAVLLIVRILTPEELKELLYLTWSLGMDALVEVHDHADLEIAQQTPAEFIGINNRNLVTFETSVQTTLDLLPYADMNRTLISESGIFTRADAIRVREAGCKGVLVGEGLVRAADVGAFARELANIKEQ